MSVREASGIRGFVRRTQPRSEQLPQHPPLFQQAVRPALPVARLEVVDFPVFGQQTNDYDEFRSRIGETRSSELRYLGVAVRGAKPEVRKLTGSLALLR